MVPISRVMAQEWTSAIEQHCRMDRAEHLEIAVGGRAQHGRSVRRVILAGVPRYETSERDETPSPKRPTAVMGSCTLAPCLAIRYCRRV